MGFDLLEELKTASEVVDLLISFASAAITGNRIEFIFPTTVTGKDSKGKDVSFMNGETKKMSVC